MTAQQAVAETEDEFVDELKPGTELMHGQYTIVSFLNSGGFGITYLAKDSLDRIVVIKECFPGNVCRRAGASVQPRSRAHQTELKSIVDLFTREAQNLAKADHPNIVGVHNVFEYNNTAYMALDYVKGRDLLDTINEDRDSLKPDQIVKYLVNLLNAIGFIHRKDILHRDISPDNIIINEHDEPVLIDFGAAREQATKKSRVLSQLRVVKDGYSPQEFYISGSEQTEASDLYSLAASFYHIITGDLPPDSQNRITAFASDEADPYIPLGDRTTDYSPAFCAALDKAMSVLPRDRVSSAEEWLGILEGSLPLPEASEGSPQGRVQSRALSQQRKQPASKMPVLLGSTAVVVILGTGMYFALNSGETSEASESAVETTTTTSASVSAPAPVALEPTVEAPEAVVVEAAPTIADADPAPAEIFEPGVLTALPSTPVIPSTEGQPDAAGFSDDAVAVAPVVASLEAAADLNVFENRSDIPAPAPAKEDTAAVEPADNTPVFSAPVTVDGPVVETPVEDTIELAALDPAAAPGESDATAEVGAAALDDVIAIAPVMTSAAPQLPFTLSDDQPGVITSVEPGARFWMVEGVQIATVNEQPFTSTEQLLDALSGAPADPRGFVSVSVGTKQPDSNIEIKRTLSAPLTTVIALMNGLTLESRPYDGNWGTFVTGAPQGSQMQVGDRIIGFVETSELIDGRLTFAEVTRRELAEGRTNFSFALERSGEVWVESFALTSLSN